VTVYTFCLFTSYFCLLASCVIVCASVCLQVIFVSLCDGPYSVSLRVYLIVLFVKERLTAGWHCVHIQCKFETCWLVYW